MDQRYAFFLNIFWRNDIDPLFNKQKRYLCTMKRVCKTILPILALFLYCIFLGQYSKNTVSKPSEDQSSNDNYHAFVYDSLFTLSNQTEESLFSTNKTPQTSLKTSFNRSVSYNQCVNLFWMQSFSRYFFWSKNVIIRLLKFNLIFPFHSFW